jgi:hypothetical protein
MRSRALVVCLLALVLTAPIGAADTTESTVAGTVRTTDSERLELSGEVTGGLQGTLTLDLGTTGADLGGSAWRLAVRRQDGTGAWYDAGTLLGVVTQGALHGSADGQAAASGPVELQITTGDGELSGVAAGSGSLTLSLVPGDPTLASGTLSLTF